MWFFSWAISFTFSHPREQWFIFADGYGKEKPLFQNVRAVFKIWLEIVFVFEMSQLFYTIVPVELLDEHQLMVLEWYFGKGVIVIMAFFVQSHCPIYFILSVF